MFKKERVFLEKEYKKLGSQRAVAKKYGCSQRTVCKYMKKLKIPAIPTMLYAKGSNSAKGRIMELYINNHPFFKGRFKDLLEVKGDKNGYDGLFDNKKVNIKSSHWIRPTFRTKVLKHKCKLYICGWCMDKISMLIPREIWIIPANKAPLSNITPGLKKKSIYDRYRLSSLRDKSFSYREELAYNRRFTRKYSKYLPKKKEGKNGK